MPIKDQFNRGRAIGGVLFELYTSYTGQQPVPEEVQTIRERNQEAKAFLQNQKEEAQSRKTTTEAQIYDNNAPEDNVREIDNKQAADLDSSQNNGPESSGNQNQGGIETDNEPTFDTNQSENTLAGENEEPTLKSDWSEQYSDSGSEEPTLKDGWSEQYSDSEIDQPILMGDSQSQNDSDVPYQNNEFFSGESQQVEDQPISEGGLETQSEGDSSYQNESASNEPSDEENQQYSGTSY